MGTPSQAALAIARHILDVRNAGRATSDYALAEMVEEALPQFPVQFTGDNNPVPDHGTANEALNALAKDLEAVLHLNGSQLCILRSAIVDCFAPIFQAQAAKIRHLSEGSSMSVEERVHLENILLTGDGEGVAAKGEAIRKLTEAATRQSRRIVSITIETLKPFANYAEKRAAKPFMGLDDIVHGIHTGTEWEAEIRLSDCDRAAKLLKELQC